MRSLGPLGQLRRPSESFLGDAIGLLGGDWVAAQRKDKIERRAERAAEIADRARQKLSECTMIERTPVNEGDVAELHLPLRSPLP